ncbi:MAG: hypothetical protein M1812_000546 [Candelaria pacifica]|nr:MAG: hypothetical protein M1812_000546 [Candelaria pacifica]
MRTCYKASYNGVLKANLQEELKKRGLRFVKKWTKKRLVKILTDHDEEMIFQPYLPPFPVMKLPLEIRHEIYDLVLAGGDEICVAVDDPYRSGLFPESNGFHPDQKRMEVQPYNPVWEYSLNPSQLPAELETRYAYWAGYSLLRANQEMYLEAREYVTKNNTIRFDLTAGSFYAQRTAERDTLGEDPYQWWSQPGNLTSVEPLNRSKNSSQQVLMLRRREGRISEHAVPRLSLEHCPAFFVPAPFDISEPRNIKVVLEFPLPLYRRGSHEAWYYLLKSYKNVMEIFVKNVLEPLKRLLRLELRFDVELGGGAFGISFSDIPILQHRMAEIFSPLGRLRELKEVKFGEGMLLTKESRDHLTKLMTSPKPEEPAKKEPVAGTNSSSPKVGGASLFGGGSSILKAEGTSLFGGGSSTLKAEENLLFGGGSSSSESLHLSLNSSTRAPTHGLYPRRFYYANWKIAELKEKCKNRGLPVNGNRAALVNRLGNSDDRYAAGDRAPPPVPKHSPFPFLKLPPEIQADIFDMVVAQTLSRHDTISARLPSSFSAPRGVPDTGNSNQTVQGMSESCRFEYILDPRQGLKPDLSLDPSPRKDLRRIVLKRFWVSPYISSLALRSVNKVATMLFYIGPPSYPCPSDSYFIYHQVLLLQHRGAHATTGEGPSSNHTEVDSKSAELNVSSLENGTRMKNVVAPIHISEHRSVVLDLQCPLFDEEIEVAGGLTAWPAAMAIQLDNLTQYVLLHATKLQYLVILFFKYNHHFTNEYLEYLTKLVTTPIKKDSAQFQKATLKESLSSGLQEGPTLVGEEATFEEKDSTLVEKGLSIFGGPSSKKV